MRNIYYGWWVLVSLFVFMAVSIGLVVNSFSFFFGPITQDLGFSLGDFSLTASISAVVAMLGCIVVGKIIHRVDIRVIVSVSTVVYVAAIIASAYCWNLSEFYVAYAFIGLGYAGIGGVGVSQIVANWFKEKQGLAMGIAMMGSGVGGMIFGPVLNWLILSYGWRNALIVVGVIVAVVTLPFSIFVVRLQPADKGLAPYGASEVSRSGASSRVAAEPDAAATGLTLAEAARTVPFWGLCVTNFAAGLLVMAVQMHVPNFLGSVGFTSSFAALVMVISNGVLIVGKLVLGVVDDVLGTRRSVLFIFALYLLTLVSLYFLRSVTSAIVFAVLFGFGAAITTVGLPLWAGAVVGSRDFAMIFAIMSMFMTIGAAVGVPLTGFIVDSTGSYGTAWLLLIAVTVVATVIAYVAVSAGMRHRAAVSVARESVAPEGGVSAGAVPQGGVSADATTAVEHPTV